MEIKLDIESFKFNPKGLSTGVLFLSSNGYQFPDNSWDDFLDLILIWWAEKLTQLIESREEWYYEMPYMDGPCSWRIDFKGKNNVTIECIRNEKIEYKFESSIEEILKELLEATNSILRYCAEKKLSNENLLVLEKHFKKLQSLRSTLKF